MPNSPNENPLTICSKCAVTMGHKLLTQPLKQENEMQEPEKTPTSICLVEVNHSTSVASIGGEAEQYVEVVESGIQESHYSPSEIHVSKLDAHDYLQWQWEKLVKQLKQLDEQYPDGSISIGEFADEPSHDSPLRISEGALLLYQKAKDLGCPEWVNRFLLLIGHRILTISKGQLFLELGHEEVCEILSSDYLDVANERSVLRAAHRWVDHDQENRARLTSYIMGCVRYGIMSKEDLIKCVVTRRRLRENIADMSPFQRSLTNGLIWLCMVDMGIEANFPEFQQPLRHHTGLHVRVDNQEPADMQREESCNAATCYQSITEQDNGNSKRKGKKAVQVVSQAATLELNTDRACGGHHQGGRGGKYLQLNQSALAQDSRF